MLNTAPEALEPATPKATVVATTCLTHAETPSAEPPNRALRRITTALSKPQPIQRDERDRKKLERWRARHQERMRELGIDLAEGLRDFGRDTWIMARESVADGSGRAIQLHLSAARKRAPAAVDAIVSAALGPDDSGKCRLTWQRVEARRCAATLLSILWSARPVHNKRGRWQMRCDGITTASFLALLECPYTRQRLHKNTLIGKHRSNGSVERGGLGYLRLGEVAEFMSSEQIPPEHWDRAGVASNERFQTPRGTFASNRYWITKLTPDNGHLPELVRARLREREAFAARALIVGLPVERRSRPSRLELAEVREALDPSPAPS